jgi:DNA-binding NarL/FixJ family response regulator
LGWQAVLHAAAGESDRALSLAASARTASRAREAETLSFLAEAIAALTADDTLTAATRLQAVLDSRIWDPVVIATRAVPQLGVYIAAQDEWRSWLQRLLSASCDNSVASRLGIGMPRIARGTSVLSPRESEVHELLAQGLTNEEIAKLLYISVSTTKVHVKHIYSKLGVRSRLEAARALRDDV